MSTLDDLKSAYAGWWQRWALILTGVGLNFALGLTLGYRLGLRRNPVPRAIQTGTGKESPGLAIGPKDHPQQVVIAPMRPGAPDPPPVPVPKGFGTLARSVRVDLPDLPNAPVIHDSLFANFDKNKLIVRDVVWAESPSGTPINVRAVTTDAEIPIPIPPCPVIPKWTVSGLISPSPTGGLRYGAEVERAFGPMVVGAGNVGGVTFAKVGFRW